MARHTDLLTDLESELFEALEAAGECGLDTMDGQFAFQRAMTALDLVTLERVEQIYEPLSGDPVTRDYIAHLDNQIRGLAARIDVLRTRIEVSLEAGLNEAGNLKGELDRMTRQLRVRFRREAALMPVFRAWQDRQGRLSA
ncbi:hypothetical protein [Maricaulis parjimensis]|uniref:hypothetical protein n=1 Tax=Maricaulis parjimensis TaxID=144023 RepID=UPI001939C5C7|nr:hypothetical protein [Maricaulis parjimensis]